MMYSIRVLLITIILYGCLPYASNAAIDVKLPNEVASKVAKLGEQTSSKASNRSIWIGGGVNFSGLCKFDTLKKSNDNKSD